MRKAITPNRLWIYRKKKGLSQKRVAFFLNQKTSSQISNYERSAKHPNLRNALKMEIIYCVPLSFLYRDLFMKLQEEVRSREMTLSKWLEEE